MRYLIFLSVSLFLFSCSSESAIEKSVKIYLADKNDTEASGITLNNISDFAPFLASDSLKVLQAKLEAQKDDIRTHLNEAIAASKKAIEAANEAKKGGFTALDGMINSTIAESERTIIESELRLKELDGDLTGTSMELMAKTIKDYESRGDELLFYMIKGSWSQAGGEEVPFRLLTAEDKVTVLGSALQ